MTQEEKSLLLKDLCARLPYGVKITDGLHITTLKVKIDTAAAVLAQFIHSKGLKYYLRPMSSMTEEEKRFFQDFIYPVCNDPVSMIDWLNENHFDYRGLIPMGLAIEAPEDMYNTKTE